MEPNAQFRDLVARVRAGDEDAATELVRQYEPEVRRLIRVRLTDPKLRVAADSADISQSVLRVFFVKVAAGAYDLNEPDCLIRLLARMIRNKVLDVARRPAVRRRRALAREALETVPDCAETPSQVLAGAELLAEVRKRLSPDELALAERRRAGAGWQEIAAAVGGTPDAARKQLSRAIQRVFRELGIDQVPDD